MEVALLANIRVEIRFVKGPSMNGINFKIVCRFYGKNVLKDPDDHSEGLVSYLSALEDAML